MSENKLRFEKSLYLLQHAENPVNWNPHGEQALNNAKELNKLIFVSVGYSSCHWCHVMAHESFEDEETAKILNDHFISIKIDREEYPDLDQYYQTATTLLTGHGGWPLSVFLTPDGKPFFAGTYFPKNPRQGLSTFKDVLAQLIEAKEKNPQMILDSADKLSLELQKPHKLDKKIEFNGHFPPPSSILNALKEYADITHGGYGQAPKFPHFAFYEWACEQILEGMIAQDQGKHIVESLERMLMGGLYDHLKGGIHRYSTDKEFLVPHFEKMLYDQAGLLKVLSKLSPFYPSPLVFDGLLQTLDYLKTEMLSEDGYFFSAQDADSEGTEGLYFTFSKEEFEQSFEEAPSEQRIKIDHFQEMFNITSKGNFEHGLNVISLNPKMKNEFYSQEGWQEVRDIRRRLLEQRKLRLPPATDRKGLVSWNAMIISSLCDIVQYCPVDIIQQEAFNLIEKCIDGLMKNFMGTHSQGFHFLKHSTSLEHTTLYLEDYINFCEAQLRLFEITGNKTFKTNAIESMDFILKNFIRDEVIHTTALNFLTPGTGPLSAPFYDQSYRSVSMQMIQVLHRLSLFKHEFSPKDIFKNSYQDFAQFVLTNPLGHGEGLRALTYPLEIYRKIEVPLEWLNKPEFIKMRSHFLGRFVMDYHERKDDSFQICLMNSCEVASTGFEAFSGLFQIKESENA